MPSSGHASAQIRCTPSSSNSRSAAYNPCAAVSSCARLPTTRTWSASYDAVCSAKASTPVRSPCDRADAGGRLDISGNRGGFAFDQLHKPLRGVMRVFHARRAGRCRQLPPREPALQRPAAAAAGALLLAAAAAANASGALGALGARGGVAPSLPGAAAVS